MPHSRKNKALSQSTAPHFACPELRHALLELSATKDGFEALTAALIEAATGGQLTLMSSGDQGGADAIGRRDSNAPRRAMQSKRYGQTSLNLNDLVGEMGRASQAFPQLDCWIIATTRPIRGKEHETLQAQARLYGWAFIALDWSTDDFTHPKLALLCAAFPAVATRWPQIAPLRSMLDKLAAEKGFSAAIKAITSELVAVDVGFLHARSAARTRLNRIFVDPAAARIIAGASPAFLKEAPPVARDELRKQIADWFTSSFQVLVLLGDEGVGKTWGAIDALSSLASPNEGPLPIVISSQRAGRHHDGFDALISMFVEIGESAGLHLTSAVAFWRKRLAIWTHLAKGTSPRILLLIDGLDELDPFSWRDWIAPLLVNEYSQSIRIILTCRKDDWNRRISFTESEPNQLRIISVSCFEKNERDHYLESRGIDIKQISQSALEAALVPRTAFHLTRLAAELGDLTSITREQLLLRDFQNRRLVKGKQLTEEAFHELVAEIATQAQEAALAPQPFLIGEGLVVDRAAAISGYDKSEMRSVLSELVSGRWCVRDPSLKNKLRFSDNALPDAVGIALAGQIRQLEPPTALKEIDRFLEPWGADDLVEKMLRTCATALIIDSNVPDVLCIAILERWYDTPMHGLAGQDFWRRLHAFRPDLFLRFCDQREYHRHEWLLEWAIASLWEDYPIHRSLVENQVADWMGKLPLPVLHVIDGQPVENRANRERTRQQRRARALARRCSQSWQTRLGSGPHELRNHIRTACRIIGSLPRTPFIPALRNWAVTVSAAGRTVGDSDVAAIVRDNDNLIDYEVAMDRLHETIDDLVATNLDLGRAAAAQLLRATGLPTDNVRAEKLRPTLVRQIPVVTFFIDDEHTVQVRDKLERRTSQQVISGLSKYTAIPGAELSPTAQKLLDHAITALTPRDVSALFEDNGRTLATLLRWRLTSTVAILRQFLLEPDFKIGESDHSLLREDYRRIALVTFPILTADQCDKVANLIDHENESAEIKRSSTTLRLVGRGFSNQISLLLSESIKSWPHDYCYLLNKPTHDEVMSLLASVDFSLPLTRIRPLLILLEEVVRRFGEIEGPKDIDWDMAFTHPDREVFARTINIARYIKGNAASESLAKSGWSAVTATSSLEAFEGSEVLFKLEENVLRHHLSSLHSEVLAHCYLHRPALRCHIAPILHSNLASQLLTEKESHTFGGRFYRYADREKAYHAYCTDYRAEVSELVHAAWYDKKLRSNIILDHDDRSAWLLIKFLAKSEPDFVKEIWHQATGNDPHIWNGEIERFPATLPHGPAFDDLRSTMLARATSDEKLISAVRELQRHGHRDFLLQDISSKLRSSRAIDRARAITISGFLDFSASANTLWRDNLSVAPGSGWLAEVSGHARNWYDRIHYARHWQRELSSQPDEVEAFAAYWLSNQVVDDRYTLYYKDPMYRVSSSSWRSQWLSFLSETRKAYIGLSRRRLKDTYNHGERYSDVIQGR